MQQTVTLTAADGHVCSGYLAQPVGSAWGGVVVLQEIFGVNPHIRGVCDRLAEAGLVSLAPALFDRYQRDYVSGYGPEDVERSRGFLRRLDRAGALRDIAAAVDHLQTVGVGPVAVMGFCMGGSLAYLSGVELPELAAAVCYYGGFIDELADRTPACPALLHFGRDDASIPMDAVERIRVRQPALRIETYPAGHGFNCEQRASYHEDSARLAWAESLDFLRARLAS